MPGTAPDVPDTAPHVVGAARNGLDPDVARYLRALLGEARGVLGGDLVGAYAAGSVALGAYLPGRSDVDLALVTASSLHVAVRERLVGRLRHESLPCPARGLELVVYTRDAAASGTPDPGFEVELNTGPRMPFRATLRPEDRPAADGLFWYGLDRSILHAGGLALAGPPAAEVFADLAPGDLRTLLVASLRWWMALPTPPGDEPAPGADDAVLGAARALVRHRWGVWLPKAAAARRLTDQGHPAADLLARAVAARAGGPPPSGVEARAFQQRVLDELDPRG
ncbi:nucleotidyltransferase domain-containing protein [Actinotalea sp. AC32]|nr:nucleotidyltransferase domain-containing protein [Actinotalea sp. AC32]